MTPNARAPTRILIAEDDPLVRKSLVSSSRRQGFTVIGEAATGPEAVEKALALHPDAILMDIEMPGFSGMEATRRIQARQPTPIVIITAHDSPELIQTVAASGAGAYLMKFPSDTNLVCAVAIAIARHADLMKLEDLSRQRELLVREVYHRVANQLGITATLLHLQSMRVPNAEARAILLESEVRVRAMARIHSFLQDTKSQTHIRLGTFLSSLIRSLVSGLRPDLAYDDSLPPEDPAVSSAVAIPCGLLIHELAMNSLRHAFPSGRYGTIRFRLTRPGLDKILLAVQDDGQGLPPGFSMGATTSLGLMIINALARDLGGTLSSASSSKSGTEFTVEFTYAANQEIP
ncbi:MAG: response regulator [bacterium]